MTLPSGQTYTTTPGSALLFPALIKPTAELTIPSATDDRGGDKAANMPRRTRTRRQNRAAYSAALRAHNRTQRHIQENQARTNHFDIWADHSAEPPDAEPPPF